MRIINLVEEKDDFFPEDILQPLTQLIIQDTGRKLVYNLDNFNHPEIIRNAVEFSRDQMRVPYNHAILKKYMIDLNQVLLIKDIKILKKLVMLLYFYVH